MPKMFNKPPPNSCNFTMPRVHLTVCVFALGSQPLPHPAENIVSNEITSFCFVVLPMFFHATESAMQSHNPFRLFRLERIRKPANVVGRELFAHKWNCLQFFTSNGVLLDAAVNYTQRHVFILIFGFQIGFVYPSFLFEAPLVSAVGTLFLVSVVFTAN